MFWASLETLASSSAAAIAGDNDDDDNDDGARPDQPRPGLLLHEDSSNSTRSFHLIPFQYRFASIARIFGVNIKWNWWMLEGPTGLLNTLREKIKVNAMCTYFKAYVFFPFYYKRYLRNTLQSHI